MHLLAGFHHSLVWLYITIGLDSHFDLLFKRMSLLVACKADSIVSKQAVSQNIAQSVILPLDQDGGSILSPGVIDASD